MSTKRKQLRVRTCYLMPVFLVRLGGGFVCMWERVGYACKAEGYMYTGRGCVWGMQECKGCITFYHDEAMLSASKKENVYKRWECQRAQVHGVDGVRERQNSV